MNLVLSLLQLIHFVCACERGLTQLRHRETLALMRCVPAMPGHPDPCIVQTAGRMSWCQPDGLDGEYVCCGSQELLIQLLAGRTMGSSSSEEYRYFPPPAHFDYNVVVRSPQPEYAPTEATQIITTPPPQFYQRTTVKPRKTSMNTMAPSPTLLSVLSNPSSLPGNFSQSLRISSNVIAVRDGRCTVIVNTGMPHQKSQIIQNLGSHGISARDVQFVVVTSSLPQFAGNLNLFPNAQIVMERHFVYKEHLIKGGIEAGVHVEICSPNTFLLATPGPTTHSVTLFARNVPSMGTVAIAGAVFPQDDSLLIVDDEFSEDAIQTIQSRREIICMADWIIPGHAPAFPVTSSLRRLANCQHRKL